MHRSLFIYNNALTFSVHLNYCPLCVHQCLMHWTANNPDTTDSCVWLFEYGAQAFFVFVFLASALAVWNNRANHALLMIEGPVRTKGIFKGIGMGFRSAPCTPRLPRTCPSSRIQRRQSLQHTFNCCAESHCPSARPG